MRYAFDHFEVPFDLIYKERVRKGNLRGLRRDRDPESGRGRGKSLVFDIEPQSGKPLAYTKSDQFQELGRCTASRKTSRAAWDWKAWSSSTSSWMPAEC